MDEMEHFNANKTHRLVRLGCILLAAVLTLLTLAPAPCAATEPASLLNASGNENRAASVDIVGNSEGFSAVLYDNGNGLPTSEANTIAETGDGFLWIGSYAGLIRYDGNVFERMDSTDGLTSIKCLYVDSRDRLWIGTNDNGVAVLERGELRRWGKMDGMKSAHTRAITEGRDGTIYVATAFGITMIDPDYRLSSLDDPAIAEADMRNLRTGSDGVIYGSTDSGDLLAIRDGKLIHFTGIADNPLGGAGAVLPDPEGGGRL